MDADYIVVGAGSAGCVVASRLSEDPSCRVVLIEAGPKDSFFWIRVPIGYAPTLEDKRFNWRYETEPEPFLGGRRISWPRGKVLGGSSSINGLVYVRGQAADYDHWRQLGNDGWSFTDVLPYFKRAEAQCRGADDYHGAGGTLCVSDRSTRDPIGDAFIASAMALGIPYNPDFNGECQEGVGYYQLTVCNGRRCSTAVGYLRPARKRHNLRVITEALTRRILFEGRRAVGIEYTRAGAPQTLRCTREVIVCAGAIISPQLLLLSGIGPADQLRENEIAVVADRPGVGANLQDHYQTRVAYRCRYPITVNDLLRNPLKRCATARSICSSTVGRSLASPPRRLGCSPAPGRRSRRPTSSFTSTPSAPIAASMGCTRSRVSCRMSASFAPRAAARSCCGPGTPPTRPQYGPITSPRRPTAGPWSPVCGSRERSPRRRRCSISSSSNICRVSTCPTEEDWVEYAKEYGGTIFHPVGTCKMGQDPMAVVDAQLRVHGVTGLRVADASDHADACLG